MRIIEISDSDLFNTEEYAGDIPVVFAHCIASDFGMYGGIALQFIEYFDMKAKLNAVWPVNPGEAEVFKRSGILDCPRLRLVGTALKIDNVYNLVTKLYTSQKPTLGDLTWSLIDCRDQMIEANEMYLAIPDMIGCGIDGLNRDDVLNTIEDVFRDTYITIYIVNRNIM